ncbi:MAG: UDP-3-O-(3-hydroxymyristoyl)glucosamine N-acyltransferase, partial [Salinibacterium sp.]|nr:UDP-3-O-(3-hydroxymyristoyl)glucosamine N-acyltransferase [Salinibacterium sp.]
LAGCRAGAVVLSPRHGDHPGPQLRHDNPRWVFAQALRLLAAESSIDPGIHPTAVVDTRARVDASAQVGPHAVIGAGVRVGARTRMGPHVVLEADVIVGDDCRLDSHAVVYRECQIGNRVTLFAGAVIGCDGFGFEAWEGKILRLEHIGITVLGDDVEIGAGSHVDRGTTGRTVVGAGTKIDNQVMIGHNCQIGRSCLIAGQTGLAGSCIVEDGVIIGGDCSVADHSLIGAGARIAGRTAVHGRVPAGAVWSGYPGRSHDDEMREVAALRRLPALLKEFRAMRRQSDPTSRPDEGSST